MVAPKRRSTTHYNTCTRFLVGNDHSTAVGCSSALEASTLGERERESGDVGSGGGARGTQTTQRASKRDREAGEGTTDALSA